MAISSLVDLWCSACQPTSSAIGQSPPPRSLPRSLPRRWVPAPAWPRVLRALRPLGPGLTAGCWASNMIQNWDVPLTNDSNNGLNLVRTEQTSDLTTKNQDWTTQYCASQCLEVVNLPDVANLRRNNGDKPHDLVVPYFQTHPKRRGIWGQILKPGFLWFHPPAPERPTRHVDTVAVFDGIWRSVFFAHGWSNVNLIVAVVNGNA